MMEQKSSLDQTSSESFFFFNPRTPCGVRQTGGEITWTRCWFQSTHSLRSATPLLALSVPSQGFQSTHSLRSATQRVPGLKMFHTVSIHALLAECDELSGIRRRVLRVSIHALLAECDSFCKPCPQPLHSFNPRTPCGVRQGRMSKTAATGRVSIHALLAECDDLQS